MRTTITTWADGFGTWHARVTQDGKTDHAATERFARVAIECELLAREPRLKLETLRVVEVLRAHSPDEMSSEWVELWPGDPVPGLEIIGGGAS